MSFDSHAAHSFVSLGLAAEVARAEVRCAEAGDSPVELRANAEARGLPLYCVDSLFGPRSSISLRGLPSGALRTCSTAKRENSPSWGVFSSCRPKHHVASLYVSCRQLGRGPLGRERLRLAKDGVGRLLLLVWWVLVAPQQRLDHDSQPCSNGLTHRPVNSHGPLE